ncbi:alkaline phosphatase family protein [Paenibacillus tarimensis]
MKAKRNLLAVLILLCLCVLGIGCKTDTSDRVDPVKMKSGGITDWKEKPVICLLIDSIMDKYLRQAIDEGRAPAMAFLLKNGHYYPRVVSSFPTMSVTIDSSLMTGTYADKHHVPGLIWYSSKENRMIYYGNGMKEALKIDQTQVAMDAVYHLNQVQLNKKTKTIHEELAEKGKDSASINGIIFRGTTEHTLTMPKWVANSTKLPHQFQVTGPKWLSYATLAQLDRANDRNTRIWDKFGMNNAFTAQETAYLIKQNQLPSFTIAYVPENDNLLHRKGPAELDGVEDADKAVQEMLDAFGSWEQALKSAVWMVLGDSAQSYVYDNRDQAIIDLRRLLYPYRIAKINQQVGAGDQLVISSNERMAYVYAIDEAVSLPDLIHLLKSEERLDIIAMKDGKYIRVTAGKNDEMISFRPGGKYKDEYGQTWTISGDPGLMDLTIKGDRIQYGKYPDGLARLYGAMHSHEGRFVVVTVQPGYEIVGEGSPAHPNGGAHGSLHEQDSLVPLIVTGTDTRPETLRIVDMKAWILKLAGK